MFGLFGGTTNAQVEAATTGALAGAMVSDDDLSGVVSAARALAGFIREQKLSAWKQARIAVAAQEFAARRLGIRGRAAIAFGDALMSLVRNPDGLAKCDDQAYGSGLVMALQHHSGFEKYQIHPPMELVDRLILEEARRELIELSLRWGLAATGDESVMRSLLSEFLSAAVASAYGTSSDAEAVQAFRSLHLGPSARELFLSKQKEQAEAAVSVET